MIAEAVGNGCVTGSICQDFFQGSLYLRQRKIIAVPGLLLAHIFLIEFLDLLIDLLLSFLKQLGISIAEAFHLLQDIMDVCFDQLCVL